MDAENWAPMIAALALVVTVINMVYTYYSQAQRATRKDVDEHTRDIATMKGQLANLPDQNSFHKLELSVMEIRGEQKLLSAENKPIAAAVKRIEDHLINNSSSSRARK